jgi:PKD repeat protein
MKPPTNIFLLLLFISSVCLQAENAPVTAAGIVTNATTAPGTVIVPVTVRNFVSIGSFTLTLRYQANLVSYVSTAPHASFPGITIVDSVNGTLGKIIITWPQTPGGVTLPDETHLLDVTFTYISGTCVLSWLYTGSNVCQYKKFSGGSYVLLNDTPKSSYYIKGGISNRGAPVTFAPVIRNPVPGNLSVPVTVNNFNAIGAMSLTLAFNQAVLSYQGCTPNPGLSGTFNAGTQVGPNGKMILTISWFGLASLADGSPVVTIHFICSNMNGSYSSLDWLETGSSCEYADAQATPLLDAPTANYYKNGAVYAREAPKVWLPVMTDAVPSGSLSLPVLVNNFIAVRSFNLFFEYDAAVMAYNGVTPDPAFGSALTVADSPSGSKRKIVLSWTGTEDKTLPDGNLIAMLNFTYHTGTSPLTWMVTDAASCRFNDASGNACFDLPKPAYYQDGLVASHSAPQTAAVNLSAKTGQQVTVPLKVFHFSTIGLFSLTLDYDPAVLTWQSASLVPSIGGTFASSAAGLGRIVVDWSGTATSLADGSDLVNLTFTYNGGATPLAFFDDGNSCRYAESPAGNSLYDLPRSSYFINGYVGPDPLSADFTASATSGDLNTTFVLTDQTTGGPTAWNWTISPSTYYFVNGTTASSQHPQVCFASGGVYSVTLVATRGASSAIMIKSGYLTVGTLGRWSGTTSSDWFTGSNWENAMVPPGYAYVVIPGSAPNWPHLAAGLSLGTLCKSISMEGTAKLYVDGDLTINAGSSLTFTGAGTLYLGGNWSNAGLFNFGAGTVEFTGPDNASILGGATPETFWKIVFAKTNAIVFIQGTVNVIGQ